MIIGPRGVGKTTYLLERTAREHLFYFSADHPLVGEHGIWAITEEAIRNGYEGVAIDEVHFARNWSTDLKAIYDSNPKLKIYASDSSSLVLRKGIADLSRRFPRYRIPFLSLREYIYLKSDITVPAFNPFKTSKWPDILDEINIARHFRSYLKGGFRPIFLEGDYEAKSLNIIEKTIFSDIPFLLPQINQNYLKLLNAIMGYLATSTVPTLNIENLSGEWSIGKEKLYELLSVLEHVELISIVRYKSDKKASGKGAKILFADPSFYSVLGTNPGTQRESFAVCMGRQGNIEVFASKDEGKADFLFDKISIEIGGKNKKIKAADYVLRDDISEPSRNILPLWSLGFLY